MPCMGPAPIDKKVVEEIYNEFLQSLKIRYITVEESRSRFSKEKSLSKIKKHIKKILTLQSYEDF